MSTVEKRVPGSFCWAELATTDLAAAKSFYGSLFAWGVRDIPMGDGSDYSIAQLGERDAAGMYGLSEKQRAEGVPPHWMVYFAVESADKTATAAQELGGKVVAGPFDVPKVGRMAFIQDPTGATFAVWQPGEYAGASTTFEIGAPGWPELATRDTVKSEAFYTRLLGWSGKRSAPPMTPYTEWQLGGRSIGGMIQMDEKWGQSPPHWMIYMMVSDCDATAAKAAQLGGRLHVPPTEIPKVGRFAVIADAQGAVFSIIQMFAPGS